MELASVSRCPHSLVANQYGGAIIQCCLTKVSLHAVCNLA